jgi:hypothetical protein
MTIEGRLVRLYTVGHVCAVLNRSRATIRRWEGESIFPPAAYILKPDRPNVRRRLYLEGFITALEELVERHPLERRLERDEWSRFSRAVFAVHAAAMVQVRSSVVTASLEMTIRETRPQENFVVLGKR